MGREGGREGGKEGGREGGRDECFTYRRNITLFVHIIYTYIHTCNKADDNSDTGNAFSFPPQYLNNNHVTYYVIT